MSEQPVMVITARAAFLVALGAFVVGGAFTWFVLSVVWNGGIAW